MNVHEIHWKYYEVVFKSSPGTLATVAVPVPACRADMLKVPLPDPVLIGEGGPTVKAASSDVQLLQAQCRALESVIVGAKTDTRRLLGEQEAEMQRQCDALGRAIHSIADTLNLTSPLITAVA